MYAVIINFLLKIYNIRMSQLDRNFIVVHIVYIYISSSLWDYTIYYYPMKPTGTLFCKSNIIVPQIVFEICAKQFNNFTFPFFTLKKLSSL